MSSSHDFLMLFQRAVKACQLYGPAHPRNGQAVKALEEGYADLLRGKTQAQVAAKNGRIFVDKVMEDLQTLPLNILAGTLEERDIHALLLFPGATVAELQALLNLLAMKPAQVRAQGGARKMLEDLDVVHFRILQVRLEDVSEAGEIAAAFLESVAGLNPGGAAGAGPGGQGGVGPGGAGTGPGAGLEGGGSGGRGGGAAGGFEEGETGGEGGLPAGPSRKEVSRAGDLSPLVSRMRDYLMANILGGHYPPDISGLGSFLQNAGLDQLGTQPNTQGVVRQAVASLEPEHQVDLFLGAAQLKQGPIRNLLGRLSSGMSAQSLARSYGRGSHSLEQVADVAGQVKALSSNPGQWRDQLMDALRQEGMSDGQIQELIEILNWDSLPVEVKLDKLMEGQRIFEMPTSKVLAFMRELLEAGRNLEFLRLMRQYAAGLFSPAVVRRTAVATGFEGIADWVDIPGMPQSLMSELMELLSRAFGREKDPEVHQWLSRAVEHILWFWVESGDPRTAHTLFTELQDVVTELSLPAPWKSQATAELLARLGSPERLDKVLGQLFLMDRQDAADRIHPYLRMLGPSAANHLVDRLSAEPDRSRRGRLLEALKSCGQVAEAPLLESLKSPEWFVVRNALIVLAEIADPERVPELQNLLLHPDARVVAAAIRAVGRLGGRAAEGALVPILNHRDPAIQMEVLFTLNEMKARQAVPALLELAKGGKGRVRPHLERIRVKALEVLGQLGSNSVIPDLRELAARRRGFFRDQKEAQPVRIQALKALARLDTPEAREAIQKVLAEEPAGAERDALQAALRERQP